MPCQKQIWSVHYPKLFLTRILNIVGHKDGFTHTFSHLADTHTHTLTSCSSMCASRQHRLCCVCPPAHPGSQTCTWWQGAGRSPCAPCWRWSRRGRLQTSVVYPEYRRQKVGKTSKEASQCWDPDIVSQVALMPSSSPLSSMVTINLVTSCGELSSQSLIFFL